MVISIFIISSSSIKRTNYYNRNKYLISDFSVQLKGLNLKGEFIFKEIGDVITHINKVIAKENSLHNEDDLIVYDVNFPIMTDVQVNLLVEKNELELTKFELLEQIKKENADLKELRSKVIEVDSKIKDIKRNLISSFKEDLDDTDDVFITFKNHKIKKLFKNAYTKDVCLKCKRCSSTYDYLK